MSGARRSAQRGFTLLELIVSMTLLGLMLAILFGGLRTGSRVWEAGEERSDSLARIQAVHGFLRRQVQELYPLTASGVAGDEPEIAFLGEPEWLRFAGLLPSHFDAGGFRTIEVGLVERDGRRHLAVAWWPFNASDEGPPDAGEDTETLLLEDVDEVAFSYFGARAARVDPDWTDRWPAGSALPSLVRLRVRFADGDRRYFPELVVRPAIDQVLPAGAATED